MSNYLKSAFLAVLALGASAASADPDDAYQSAMIPGTSKYAMIVVRTATATGASIMCVGTKCINVAEAKAPGAGAYRLVSGYEDTAVTDHVWNLVRVDAKSGHMWSLSYDGTAASWADFTGP